MCQCKKHTRIRKLQFVSNRAYTKPWHFPFMRLHESVSVQYRTSLCLNTTMICNKISLLPWMSK